MAVARIALVVLVVGATATAARPFRVRLTPFEVEPGRDRIPCEYLAFPNERALDVQRFAVHSRLPLHHIIFYAYVGENRDPQYFTAGALRDGVACFALGPPDMAAHSTGLLGAVRPGRYDLPVGYAVTLLPHQPVGVVTHAFNRTRKTKRAAVSLTVVPAKPGDVRHHLEPLDVLALWFEVLPHQTTVYIGDFVAPRDMNVAMLASHQHRFGTRVTIWPVIDGVEQPQVYENLRWREPRIAWQDAPIHLRTGDRLRMRCEWNNTSDEALHFGGSATDEMCNMNGYFFRDQEVAPGERGGVGGILETVTE